MDFLLRKIFSRLVKQGALEIVTAGGRTLRFGDGSGEPVRVRFKDYGAQLALLMEPELRMGELFMNERLIVERGTVYDFLDVVLAGARHVKPPLLTRVLERTRYVTGNFLRRNLPAQSRRNVAHHYDLDERLYALFLDEDRQYSCAYFETPDATLEEAQLAKKRHIVSKMHLKPGQTVLDIGCGWGGMALYLARIAGAGTVMGITLSQEQIGLARQRASHEGVADKVAFDLVDYRAVTGPFDRIVSVGMFEHVGLSFYDTFFQNCHRLLNEDGVMVLHTIGNADTPAATNPWITRYIFPGGHIPALSEILPAIERAGLMLTDVEVWRLHYARTLRLWRERFMARREEAVALYDERFCRMWEYYLSMSEAAFRHEGIVVFQLQLVKQQETVPLTRAYMGAQEEALRARDTPALHKVDTF